MKKRIIIAALTLLFAFCSIGVAFASDSPKTITLDIYTPILSNPSVISYDITNVLTQSADFSYNPNESDELYVNFFYSENIVAQAPCTITYTGTKNR